MSREIFIGDVHGCLEELQELLGLLRVKEADKVYFVGDLVDKGPYSKEVVELVSELPNAFCVQGNHEAVYVSNYLNHGHNPHNLTPLQVDWLSELPIYHRTPLGITVVHGGIFPAYYANHPPLASIRAPERMGSKWRDRVKRFRFCRYINEAGNVTHNEQDTSKTFWANKYEGQDGLVIFGHQPFLDVTRFNHALGIDTGCVHGNLLSACFFYENNPRPFKLSVEAKRQYAELKEMFDKSPVSFFPFPDLETFTTEGGQECVSFPNNSGLLEMRAYYYEDWDTLIYDPETGEVSIE